MDALDAFINRSITSHQHTPAQRVMDVVKHDPELAGEALLVAINLRFDELERRLAAYKKVEGV